MSSIVCKTLVSCNLLLMVWIEFSVNEVLIFLVGGGWGWLWGEGYPMRDFRVSFFCFEISKHTTKINVCFLCFWTWILMDCRWVFLKHKRCDLVDSARLKFKIFALNKKLQEKGDVMKAQLQQDIDLGEGFFVFSLVLNVFPSHS